MFKITAGSCYHLPPSLFLLLRKVLALPSPWFLHSGVFPPLSLQLIQPKMATHQQPLCFHVRDSICTPRLVSIPSLDILRQMNLKVQPAYMLNILLCSRTTHWPTPGQKENSIQIEPQIAAITIFWSHLTGVWSTWRIWLRHEKAKVFFWQQIPWEMKIWHTNKTCRIMQWLFQP